MGPCTVDSEASPQFATLTAHWERRYPHIRADLKKLFDALKQNPEACGCSRIQAGDDTGAILIFKYRQNSSDIRQSAKYGWRVIAVYYRKTNTLFPIIVYPKPSLANADIATILAAFRELQGILKARERESPNLQNPAS